MIHCNIPHLSSSTINGFTGGSIMMSLIGSVEIDRTFVTCSTLFSLEVPSCNSNQGRLEMAEEKLPSIGSKGNIVLYPNPAHDKVNIRFETDAPASQVEVYDLLGRLISSFESTATQGVIDLDLAPMARGVYVVVLRQGSQILMQRKLQVY